MLAPLPEMIDPMRLARLGQRLQGELDLARMSRLGDSLYAKTGYARIDWRFELDAQYRPVVRGQVWARLTLQCQRCLGSLEWDIEHEVRLGILKPGQDLDSLTEDYEPLELAPVPMALSDIVEDELILALPLAPTHVVCPAHVYVPPGEPESAPVEAAGGETRPNPFQVLAGLKKP